MVAPVSSDPAVRVRALAAKQDSLITAWQALHCGLTRYDIRTRIRRREWLALIRGVYLTEAELYVDGLPQPTWWRAALLAHGQGACLVGSTALRALGVAGLPAVDDHILEISVPGGVSKRPRASRESLLATFGDGPIVRVRQLVVPPQDVIRKDGLQVRSIIPSLADVGLLASRPVALSILDSALNLGLIVPDDLPEIELRARGRRGAVKLRDLLPFADGRAESPLESRVRLACIDGHVAPDELQYAVRDRFGMLVALGDLAWIKFRRRPLIAEADGVSVHALPEAVFRDRRRGNAITAQSCDTIRFTWADAMQPRRIAAAVRAALTAA